MRVHIADHECCFHLPCRSITLDDIIVLLIYTYSLMGDESSHSATEVRKIQECLMDAILADEKPSELITMLGEEFNSVSFIHLGNACCYC